MKIDTLAKYHTILYFTLLVIGIISQMSWNKNNNYNNWNKHNFNQRRNSRRGRGGRFSTYTQTPYHQRRFNNNYNFNSNEFNFDEDIAMVDSHVSPNHVRSPNNNKYTLNLNHNIPSPNDTPLPDTNNTNQNNNNQNIIFNPNQELPQTSNTFKKCIKEVTEHVTALQDKNINQIKLAYFSYLSRKNISFTNEEESTYQPNLRNNSNNINTKNYFEKKQMEFNKISDYLSSSGIYLSDMQIKTLRFNELTQRPMLSLKIANLPYMMGFKLSLMDISSKILEPINTKFTIHPYISRVNNNSNKNKKTEATDITWNVFFNIDFNQDLINNLYQSNWDKLLVDIKKLTKLIKNKFNEIYKFSLEVVIDNQAEYEPISFLVHIPIIVDPKSLCDFWISGQQKHTNKSLEELNKSFLNKSLNYNFLYKLAIDLDIGYNRFNFLLKNANLRETDYFFSRLKNKSSSNASNKCKLSINRTAFVKNKKKLLQFLPDINQITDDLKYEVNDNNLGTTYIISKFKPKKVNIEEYQKNVNLLKILKDNNYDGWQTDPNRVAFNLKYTQFKESLWINVNRLKNLINKSDKEINTKITGWMDEYFDEEKNSNPSLERINDSDINLGNFKNLVDSEITRLKKAIQNFAGTKSTSEIDKKHYAYMELKLTHWMNIKSLFVIRKFHVLPSEEVNKHVLNFNIHQKKKERIYNNNNNNNNNIMDNNNINDMSKALLTPETSSSSSSNTNKKSGLDDVDIKKKT